jgi:hypothetical protein
MLQAVFCDRHLTSTFGEKHLTLRRLWAPSTFLAIVVIQPTLEHAFTTEAQRSMLDGGPIVENTFGQNHVQ